MIRKRSRTLELRREIIKSPNKNNNIFVITVALLDILNLIAING